MHEGSVHCLGFSVSGSSVFRLWVSQIGHNHGLKLQENGLCSCYEYLGSLAISLCILKCVCVYVAENSEFMGLVWLAENPQQPRTLTLNPRP